MSKTKKALKRKRNADAGPNPTTKKGPAALPTAPTSSNGAEPVLNLASVVSEEEVEITVDTLRTLSQHPFAIKARGCKELRSAVYDFRQACTTGVNTADGADAKKSLTARVEAALVDDKYLDAIVLLAEMRIRDQAPKLGALCRWVRHLDAVSGLAMVQGNEKPRTPRQFEVLRALDAVLRLTGTADLHPESLPLPAAASSAEPLALQKLWDLRPDDWKASPIRRDVLSGHLLQEHCPPDVKARFEILEVTPGPERKPPNLHQAILYLTQDNTVPLSKSGPAITHHHHPQVPNLSLLRDVLSADECKSIIAATETIGYLPDAPIRDEEEVAAASPETAPSVLAHNVYWLIDPAFHDALWSRVQPHIPAAADGRRARSINRRFRVYRYVPGAEYRCHFDGAWPPSGVQHDALTGKKKYMWDSSPADHKQSSLFTFLLYLNDEFEGGETTFFTPSLREGVMNAHPVRPVMGSVALFPHGESRGALLHEGTGVRKGAKYIIRTDVEFDVEASS